MNNKKINELLTIIAETSGIFDRQLEYLINKYSNDQEFVENVKHFYKFFDFKMLLITYCEMFDFGKEILEIIQEIDSSEKDENENDIDLIKKLKEKYKW